MGILRTRKLVIFLVAILSAFCFALGLSGFKTAKADVLLSNYFAYETGSSDLDVMSIDNGAKFKVFSGKSVEAKYKLTVNDLGLKFTLPADATEFVVKLNCDSYFGNGNETETDVFKKTVENKLVVNVGQNVTFNGVENAVVINKGQSFYLYTTVNADGFVVASIMANGARNALSTAYTANTALRVENVDKTWATLSFSANVAEGVTNYMVLESINQKASKGENFETNVHYQDFVELNGGIKNTAECLIEINAGLFAKEGNKLVAEIGRKYDLVLQGTNVFGNFNETSYVVETDSTNAIVENKTVVFTTAGDCKLIVKNSGIVVEEYDVVVRDEVEDTLAPVYDLSNGYMQGVKAFQKAIDNMVYDAEGNTKVSIGSSQYLTLNKNMFKGLVKDDYTGFDGLTCKIYYKSETKSGDVSNYKIPLREAGHYQFYVTFIDHNGNEMDVDNFYFNDAIDSNVVLNGIYADYIFSFDIVDTSELSIDTLKVGTGYVGAKYNALPFDIDATFEYTDTYKLYYATNVDKNNPNSADWVEITKLSSATDKDKDYKGYTYEEIRNIAYDGKLSFVPDRTGFYKLEMSVSSSSSTKKGTESVIIEVVEPVKEVKVGKTWIEENVWSVVYLSVGTVCLIAILVLLFIKPKDEDEFDVL